MKVCFSAAFLLTAAALGATSASAATLAQVTSSTCVGTNTIDQDAGTGLSSVGVMNSSTGSTCRYNASAQAAGGYAGVFAEARSSSEASRVFARATWSASVGIGAAAGYSGGDVDVSVLYGLSFLDFFNLPSDGDNNGSALIDWRAIYTTNASSAGSLQETITRTNAQRAFEGDPGSQQTFGLTQVYQSKSFSVTPGVDSLALSISLDVTVEANHPGNIAEALFDGFSTASLNPEGAAFVFTQNGEPVESVFVNSPENNIFNNVWVDPRVSDDPSAIPLPAGLLLLLSALGGTTALKRRRSLRVA